MIALIALGWLADVAILGTYAYLSRTGKATPFHLANVLGAIPLLLAEIVAGLWQVLALTLAFCLIGAYAVVLAEYRRRHPVRPVWTAEELQTEVGNAITEGRGLRIPAAGLVIDTRPSAGSAVIADRIAQRAEPYSGAPFQILGGDGGA